ncbi:MAG: FtsX-like permease family protein [Candidatus Methanoperedens sp.]|nr:FtsX-like permease family protein [Candidatus Methanoperedens sp.]
MISVRWRKVLRDMWLNKSRTVLVVLAIAIGIFGVGSVLTGYAILTHEIDANFLATNPASAILYTDNADKKLAEYVEKQNGVADAQARRVVMARIKVGQDDWRRLLLFVIDDFDDLRVSTFTLERGEWPPADREILIERSALPLINKQVGDIVVIHTQNNGQEHDLRVSGIVHDPAQSPGWVDNVAYGYITLNTLEWLGETRTLNELNIVAENKNDVSCIALQVKDDLEDRGYNVSLVEIPNAGKHPQAGQMDSLLFLLEAFGILALILSSVLVASTISALLAQQIRQIGVMKVVGARTYQIAGLYFGTVLLLGIAGLVIGIPTGIWAGKGFAAFTAKVLNFNITSDFIPHWVYAVQIFVGLSVPLLAAAFPVYRGSRITVKQAISDYGTGNGQFGTNRIDKLISSIRGISRPLLLSLRNAFRQRSRMLLTIGILAVGGATFMSAINVGASWTNTIDIAMAARHDDIEVKFSQPYPTTYVEQTVRAVPGISSVESWVQTVAIRKQSDDTDDTAISFTFNGVPPQTDMISFPVIEGRWLRLDDTNALVINHELLEAEGIKVGDRIMFKTGNKEMEWTVVGIVRELGARKRGQNIAASAYVNLDYLARITDMEDKTTYIRIKTDQHSGAALRTVTGQLEEQFDTAGLDRISVSPSTERLQVLKDHLVVIQMFLLAMAALVAAVGGLALASTMGINVMERAREFGIMRAIGACSDDVLQIVVVEGIVISVLSWLAAVVISRPLSVIIGNFAGNIFIHTDLEHVFPPIAVALWLILVIFIGTFASAYPAWRETRLPVQQVLAYG